MSGVPSAFPSPAVRRVPVVPGPYRAPPRVAERPLRAIAPMPPPGQLPAPRAVADIIAVLPAGSIVNGVVIPGTVVGTPQMVRRVRSAPLFTRQAAVLVMKSILTEYALILAGCRVTARLTPNGGGAACGQVRLAERAMCPPSLPMALV